MMRGIAFTILFIVSTSALSQRLSNSRFYLNASSGVGIPLSNSVGILNHLEMKYTRPFVVKGSAWITLKNNVGLHINVTAAGYNYDIPAEGILASNPNYILWDRNNSYTNFKLAALTGVAWKLNYLGLVITPYVDIGVIAHASASMSSYTMKERDSNNLRHVRNKARLQYHRFDYDFGADVYYHMGTRWGFAGTIQFDRFSGSSQVRTTTTEWDNSTKIAGTENQNFKHRNVLITLGMFMSFFHSGNEN